MRADAAIRAGIAFAFTLLAVALPGLPPRAGFTPATHYVLHCQGCHGADGYGELPGMIPPLRGSVGYFTQVPGGRAYLAQVPGVAQAPLADAELAALLDYVLDRFAADERAPGFASYSADEVGRLRRESVDVVAVRSRLSALIRERTGAVLWEPHGS
jgi:mono/diheme cytochrome c family protein